MFVSSNKTLDESTSNQNQLKYVELKGRSNTAETLEPGHDQNHHNALGFTYVPLGSILLPTWI